MSGLRVERSGSDLVLDWDAAGGADGYHVLVDVAPSLGKADLAGRTSGATTLTLTDGAAPLPALEFFQVRAINACNWEGP